MRECCWGRREGRHRGVFVVFHCVFGTANDVGGTGTGTVYAGTVVQVQGLMKLFTCKKTCSEHFTHATISLQVHSSFTVLYTNKYSNQLKCLKVNVPESQTLQPSQ